MGKATIIENMGQGFYKIELNFNKGNYEIQVSELTQKIKNLDKLIPILKTAIDSTLPAFTEHTNLCLRTINAFKNQSLSVPSNAWETAAIRDYLAENEENHRIDADSIKDLSNTFRTINLDSLIIYLSYWVSNNQKTISKLRETYLLYVIPETLPPSFHIPKQLDQALESQVKTVGDLKQGVDLIKAKYAEFVADKKISEAALDKLKKFKFDIPTQAWCADYTLDLAKGDIVATIELPHEREIVQSEKTRIKSLGYSVEQILRDDSKFPAIIRPAFVDRAKFDKSHGMITPAKFMPIDQFKFNWLSLAAISKWKPKYRRGYIRAMSADKTKCDVQLEKHYSSQPDKWRYIKAIDVTQVKENVYYDGDKYGWHINCPIKYMSCDGAVFSVGDHVIIEYENQDRRKPKVIGFVSEPKPCIQYEFFCSDRVDNDFYMSREIRLALGFDQFALVSKLYIQGAGVRLSGKNNSSPVFSHINEDTAQIEANKPPRWYKIPYTYPINSDQALPDKTKAFKSYNVWQNQRLFEYIFFPKDTVKTFISSPSGAGPYARTYAEDSAYISQLYFQTDFLLADSGLDIRASLYSPASITGVESPKIFPIGGLPAPRYWRRHAMQIVDGIAYVIATDAMSRFYVYPLAHYGMVDDANNGGIRANDSKIKTVDIQFPAWYKPLPEPRSEFRPNNSFYWNFSSDGKKAVSVIHTSETISGIFTWLGQSCENPPSGYESLFKTCVEQASGMVEIAINITINKNDKLPYGHDFDVTCPVITEDFSCETGRLILAADYAFKNSKLEKQGIQENDLITLDCDLRFADGFFDFYAEKTGVDFRTASYSECMNALANYFRTRTRHDIVQISTPENHYSSCSFTINKNDKSLSNGEINIIEIMSIPVYKHCWNTLSWGTFDYFSIGNKKVPVSENGNSWVVYPFEQASFYDFNFIEALDLRSISAVISHNDGQGLGESLGFYYYIFGEYREGKSIGATVPPTVDLTKQKCPNGMQWLAGYISLLHFNPSPLQSISTHPDGHFAVSMPRLYGGTGKDMDVDLIRFADGSESTHLAEYNKAFVDNREYSYYSADSEALKGMPRTFGVWI